MSSRRTLAVVVLGFGSLASVVVAQSTERVSLSSRGAQTRGLSHEGAISADGRFVAFRSDAPGMVGDNRNWWDDIFVRDRWLGATTRVSVDSSGASSNQASAGPSISLDGRWVAFESFASNLVAGDTNGAYDVFVHDRANATTQRASVSSSGVPGDLSSHYPSLSGDARWVAFESAATNLVAGDTNGVYDVFVHDLATGATTRVSLDSNGLQANGSSARAALSSDGRYVAFQSAATNLVAGDTNGAWDVFVHDRSSATTVRVSVDSGSLEANGSSWLPSISGDGQRVVFGSAATNLVGSDTNGADDVFVHDLSTGATVLASVGSNGVRGNAASYAPKLSASGRFVVFSSAASNLVALDANLAVDVFVRDLHAATTTLESVDSAGVQGNGDSGGFFVYNGPDTPSLSADGRFVVFGSAASNLVAGDTNQLTDTFVRDRGAPAPISFCTAGVTSNGCVPAISGSGSPSASAASGFTIAVAAVEGSKQGLIYYGIDNSGWTPIAWGASSSFQCVRPPLQRTPAQSSGGTANACDGALSIDWNAFVASRPNALGVPFAVGASVFAQAWFRDPASPGTTMLSDALEFVLAP